MGNLAIFIMMGYLVIYTIGIYILIDEYKVYKDILCLLPMPLFITAFTISSYLVYLLVIGIYHA